MTQNDQLLSDQLRQDSRVQEAKRLLAEALQEHSSRITGVSAAVDSLKQSYSEALQQLADVRGGSLFYPYLGSGIGRGSLVELADGSVKYDLITGIGVHAFGHSDVETALSQVDAALSDTVMQGNLQQNREVLGLSRDLIALANSQGARLSHCFLSTSGAMANENALKILFQKRFPANRVLAFENNFSGRTLALSQITDRAGNRVGLPATLAVDYIPFYDASRPEESTATAVQRLKALLDRYPDRHAAMIMELIQGEGGYYSAPQDFFVSLLECLKSHRIPVIFDEIQTFGRTTQPFAFQHLKLDDYADVVTVGKMTQVCATLFRSEFQPKPGLVSQTFTGATSTLFAARSFLKRLMQGGYYGPDGRIMQIHQRFVQHFEEIQRRLPGTLFSPWGEGVMLAFTVGQGDAATTRKVLDALYEAGVIAFSAGQNPTRIRMLPAFAVIQDSEIDDICRIIADVLESMEEQTGG